MAAKRLTRSDELANEVELAAFMIDNEADNIADPDLLASDLTHMSINFAPQTLPLTMFLHAMAAQLREMAERIRKLK